MSLQDWRSIFVFCLIVVIGTVTLPRDMPDGFERIVGVWLVITIVGGVVIGAVQFALTGALQ